MEVIAIVKTKTKMKKKFVQFIIRILYKLLWFCPRKFAIKVAYFIRFRKKIDLLNPKTLNEKIEWLLLNRYGSLETMCADKILVRKYLEQKNLGFILTKIYGVWDRPEEIDYDKLPDQFVIKCNHGCGTNVICKDKSKLDVIQSNKQLNKWLKIDFAKPQFEYQYHNIKRKIFCEEYLDMGIQDILDYKIHCFNGKPQFILVCSERSKELKLSTYDLQWNRLKYIVPQYESMVDFEEPMCLDKMIHIAEMIATDFTFVRVDLYNINGKIYFSELTFTPEAGRMDYYTEETQLLLGHKLQLVD